MDSWERFNETSLLDKKAFYSELNLQDITDENNAHTQKLSWLVCSMSYIIASRCVWKFRDKCIKIYGLDPVHFLSAPGLAWQACLKRTGVELELLTDPDMLLMVEEGIKGEICQSDI